MLDEVLSNYGLVSLQVVNCKLLFNFLPAQDVNKNILKTQAGEFISWEAVKCNLNIFSVWASSKIFIKKLFLCFLDFTKKLSRPNSNLNICCCWLLLVFTMFRLPVVVVMISLNDFIGFFNI